MAKIEDETRIFNKKGVVTILEIGTAEDKPRKAGKNVIKKTQGVNARRVTNRTTTTKNYEVFKSLYERYDGVSLEIRKNATEFLALFLDNKMNQRQKNNLATEAAQRIFREGRLGKGTFFDGSQKNVGIDTGQLLQSLKGVIK